MQIATTCSIMEKPQYEEIQNILGTFFLCSIFVLRLLCPQIIGSMKKTHDCSKYM